MTWTFEMWRGEPFSLQPIFPRFWPQPWQFLALWATTIWLLFTIDIFRYGMVWLWGRHFDSCVPNHRVCNGWWMHFWRISHPHCFFHYSARKIFIKSHWNKPSNQSVEIRPRFMQWRAILLALLSDHPTKIAMHWTPNRDLRDELQSNLNR